MSRVLITGSSDGLGLMAAQRLLAGGHEVVLHARNQGRARDARTAAPTAHGLVVGDLASVAETRGLADQANRLGPFDAIIHNAGVGDHEHRIETVDGLDRKSTRLNSSHMSISYAVFCLKKKKNFITISSNIKKKNKKTNSIPT